MMKLFLLIPYDINSVNWELLKIDAENRNYNNFQAEVVFNYKKPGYHLLLKGKPPVNGRCEKIHLLLDDRVIPGEVDEYGNIDYLQKKFLVSLKKGDTVAKVENEVESEDGYDIKGNTLFATYDNDPLYMMGEGLEKSGFYLVAQDDGVLSIREKTINVLKLVKIKGDASILTGNIYSSTSLLIDGNIQENIEIEVEGDLYLIGGVFQPKKMIINGNLYCKKGIVGRNEATYLIKGDVICEFLENCKIQVRNNLIVQRLILRSTVECNKNIILTQKEGQLLSSIVKCYGNMYINTIGKSAGGKNRIYLGYSYYFHEIKEKIDAMAEKLSKITNKNSPDYHLKARLVKEYSAKIANKLYNVKSKLAVLNTIFQDNLVFFYHGNYEFKKDMQGKIFLLDVDFNFVTSNINETIRSDIRNYCDSFYKLIDRVHEIDDGKIEVKNAKEFKKSSHKKQNKSNKR